MPTCKFYSPDLATITNVAGSTMSEHYGYDRAVPDLHHCSHPQLSQRYGHKTPCPFYAKPDECGVFTPEPTQVIRIGRIMSPGRSIKATLVREREILGVMCFKLMVSIEIDGFTSQPIEISRINDVGDVLEYSNEAFNDYVSKMLAESTVFTEFEELGLPEDPKKDNGNSLLKRALSSGNNSL